jgi:hypothetical protein
LLSAGVVRIPVANPGVHLGDVVPCHDFISIWRFDVRNFFTVAFLLSMFVLTFGCGADDKLLPLKGRILKGGVKFEPAPLEIMQVIFVPVPANGEPVRDHYFANFNDMDSTFVVAGKTGKGLPPGRYRVSLELMKDRKDQYHGKCDAVQSPYVFEIDQTTKEVVIELDKLTGV